MVSARGHPNIRAHHPTTMEVTKEETLTPRGDCIIAVAANKSAAELSPRLLGDLARGYSLAVAVIVRDLIDVFFAEGAPGHVPTSTTSIVIRRSEYLDERTLGIRSTKAARDLDRRMVHLLKDRGTKVLMIFVTAPSRKEALRVLVNNIDNIL